MKVLAEEDIPECLNETLIVNSLKCALDCGHNDENTDKITILKRIVMKTVNVGDSYMSDIFRVHVTYSFRGEESKISLIVKCIEDKEPCSKVKHTMNIYPKEKRMYLEILPELSYIAANEFFSPKCFYTSENPTNLLVFEDLAERSFQMANRAHGLLDLEHCKLIFSKMGKFHAASMILADRHPDMFKEYNYNFFDPLKKTRGLVTDMCYKSLLTFIKSIENGDIDVDRVILNKLRFLVPIFYDKFEKCMNQSNENGFSVLNHGDLWFNNLLFEYGVNGPTDVAFLDYQISFYTSPGLDINYCLYTCPKTEVRERHRLELFDVYYHSLFKTLSHLNYTKIPSFADVLVEIQKFSLYGLISAISFLPLVYMKGISNENEPVVEPFADENLYRKCFKNEAYQDAIIPILQRFEELGKLDFRIADKYIRRTQRSMSVTIF